MTAALDTLRDGIELYGHPEGGFSDEQAAGLRALADLDALVRAAQVVVDEHAADNPFVGYSVEALALHLARVKGDAA